MVTVRQVDASFLETYDRIPMRVPVRCVYRLEKVDRGLGGILLREEPVEPYVKDLGKYDRMQEYETRFEEYKRIYPGLKDISHRISGRTSIY